MSQETVYRIPEYVAYVHTEEFAPHSPTGSYVADLRTCEIMVFEGSASIIWGVFEEPTTVAAAVADIAELAGQNPADITGHVKGFVADLLRRGYLQEVQR